MLIFNLTRQISAVLNWDADPERKIGIRNTCDNITVPTRYLPTAQGPELQEEKTGVVIKQN